MKYIYLIISLLFFSNSSFANSFFETKEYELIFTSKNINLDKDNKIEDIKIKSFYDLMKKIVTDNNLDNLNYLDIDFVNKFILNFKVNNEKIINDNYYSKIKVNFNIDLIYNYLISEKIPFIYEHPDKFLIIIIDQNELQSIQISKKNKFYKFLINSNNKLFNKFFLLPSLDNNDRYILNESYLDNKELNPFKRLNDKYNTEYQIILYSKKINNLYINDIYLFYENKKYFITKIPTSNLNFNQIFESILSKSLDKWKELNQIKTNSITSIECEIKINNIYELKYVKSLLNENRLINNFTITSIKFNSNTYTINFFDNISLLKKSLQLFRLNLLNDNNYCVIELT